MLVNHEFYQNGCCEKKYISYLFSTEKPRKRRKKLKQTRQTEAQLSELKNAYMKFFSVEKCIKRRKERKGKHFCWRNVKLSETAAQGKQKSPANRANNAN